MTTEQVEAQARPPGPVGGRPSARRRRGGLLATYFTPKEPIPRPAVPVLIAVGFAIPLALWSFLTYGNILSPDFLPSPTTVVAALWTMLTQDNFIVDIWASTYRIFLGFIISAIVGVPLGILIGSFRTVQALFEYPISFARYLPASAFIPLLIVWFGLEDSEKVAVIIIGSFFQLTLLVADISAGVQKELLNIAYTLGASRWQVFTRVLIPASLPGVVDTLRIIIGWAWTYLIVAELVAAQSGIGHVILQAQRFSNTDQIVAGILAIGILGLITDAAFRLLHRLLFPYVERIAR
ncbi:MAG TPA: ABC transporter permease [Chloroflexota bacterium]|nr:ABC transporter permease [Chloroflexota bacterium]